MQKLSWTKIKNRANAFAVQYKANSNRALKEYLDKIAPFHKNEIRQKFGEQVLFFETYLELVSKQA